VWRAEELVLSQYHGVSSQSGIDDPTYATAQGVLLFVTANGRSPMARSVNIQGHRIRFLSVELPQPPQSIRPRWSLCAEA
jgi:5-methylcytosine-specific restriction enzyme subunit McrC